MKKQMRKSKLKRARFYRMTAMISVLVLTVVSIIILAESQWKTDAPNATEELSYSEQISAEENSAVSLTTTSSLMEKQSDGTTKFITQQENTDGTSFRRTITNSTATSLSADTRDVFTILEIIPDYKYTYFSWLISGCEPVSENTMTHLANCDNGSADFIFGKEDSPSTSRVYPVTVIANGTSLLELPDYDAFTKGKSKAVNGWLMVKDSTVTTNESGYFKYVGEGKGLYQLSNFVKSYNAVNEGTGSYTINPASGTTQYVVATAAEATYYTYTQNNYDLYYKATFGDAYSNAEKYAYTASMTDTGTYIAKYRTVSNVYNSVKNTTGDYNLVYYEYVGSWDGVGTDPYEGKRCIPNFTTMQEIVDGYQLYGNQFKYNLNTADVIYNPGHGQYKAVLNQTNPYIMSNNGNYECTITDVTSSTGDIVDVTTAGTNVNLCSWTQGSYIWVPVTEEEALTLPTTSYADYATDKTNTYIYLKNYSRTYAYYSRNGYVNNEFFKTICIDVTRSLDTSKSDYENYYSIISNGSTWAQAITDFNHEYRIEIRCVTPDQVTENDLLEANLIYAGEDTPYDGGSFSSGLAQEWKDYEGLSEHATFTRDLPSFTYDVLIYKNAILNNSTPIPFMYSASLAQAASNSHLGKTSNLYKLFMLFNVFTNETEMRQFIKGYQTDDAIKDYVNYIDETTGQIYIHCIGGAEQQTRFTLDWSAVTWEPRDYWERNDFLIWADSSVHYSTAYGKYAVNYATFEEEVDNIQDGDHSLMYHWYTRGFSMSTMSCVKIYTLLQGWNSRLNVKIDNAVTDYNGNNIIYVDEFDNGYPVEFTVTSTETLSNVKVYYDVNANGTVDGGDVLITSLSSGSLTAGADHTYSGTVDLKSTFGANTKRNILVVALNNSGRTGNAAALMMIREIPDLN